MAHDTFCISSTGLAMLPGVRSADCTVVALSDATEPGLIKFGVHMDGSALPVLDFLAEAFGSDYRVKREMVNVDGHAPFMVYRVRCEGVPHLQVVVFP